MRIATWDSNDPEMHFDNPNLRWGSPSYLLEPGDPGYVAPFPSVTTTKNKRKSKMKHNNYFPIRQADQVIWLGNYRNKLPGYATVLGLAPALVTSTQADCDWVGYLLESWQPAVRTWALGCTDTVAEAQTGTGGSAMILPTFTAPELPASVVAVAPGALTRIFALVQQIKNSGKCTDAIASDLGLVGSQATAPDLAAVQPKLTATVSGNVVGVKWNWQGHRAWLNSCEILVDRGDGKGFVLLTIDTTPDYTDTEPFPATKTVWSYKATYRTDDQRVGLWSQTVSVVVGG